jgi:hypothetical protein
LASITLPEGAVAQNRSALFQLDDARKQLSGGGRAAIQQHDHVPGERILSFAFYGHWRLRIPRHPVRNLDVMIEYPAQQILKTSHTSPGITAQIEDEGGMFTRFADNFVLCYLAQIENRHL